MTTSVKTNHQGAEEYLQTSNNSVIIIGNVGRGKTCLVRKQFPLREQRMVSASYLAEIYADKENGGKSAINAAINKQIHYSRNRVVIDDLGKEPNVKHFTNELCPVSYVIERIYDHYQTSKPEERTKLYLTTNLNESELKEKYGIRIVDRIWEMCDRLIIEDKNLRKEPLAV